MGLFNYELFLNESMHNSLYRVSVDKVLSSTEYLSWEYLHSTVHHIMHHIDDRSTEIENAFLRNREQCKLPAIGDSMAKAISNIMADFLVSNPLGLQLTMDYLSNEETQANLFTVVSELAEAKQEPGDETTVDIAFLSTEDVVAVFERFTIKHSTLPVRWVTIQGKFVQTDGCVLGNHLHFVVTIRGDKGHCIQIPMDLSFKAEQHQFLLNPSAPSLVDIIEQRRIGAPGRRYRGAPAIGTIFRPQSTVLQKPQLDAWEEENEHGFVIPINVPSLPPIARQKVDMLDKLDEWIHKVMVRGGHQA